MNTLWTRSDCSLPSCLGQKRFHFSTSCRNQLREGGGRGGVEGASVEEEVGEGRGGGGGGPRL